MNKDKKPFKETKFGKFLNKAKEAVPELADVGMKLITGNIGGAVEEVGSIIKKKAETDAKAKDLLYEFERDKLQYNKDVFALEVDDRKDARKNGNKHLQILVAYFSLLGFTIFACIQIWLCYEILINELKVNEFIIMTASNIFGIFTGLIFTLKDFLFGGSVDK